MRLDTVHDVQSAYRRLVRATSYPGTIVDVSHEAAKIDLDTGMPGTLLLLAVMLLDAEVEFAIDAPAAPDAATVIAQLTYGHEVGPDRAGYVFLPASGDGSTSAAAAHAIGRARIGTLTEPHLGATVVLEVPSLAVDRTSSAETRIALTGPGIEDETIVALGGATEWMEAREDRNQEYPLGIDVIVYTAHGILISLPRTTRMEREV